MPPEGKPQLFPADVVLIRSFLEDEHFCDLQQIEWVGREDEMCLAHEIRRPEFIARAVSFGAGSNSVLAAVLLIL